MVTANQRANTQLSASQEERSSWEHRGTTTIPARVVEKIVAEAANESANVAQMLEAYWELVPATTSTRALKPSVNSTAR